MNWLSMQERRHPGGNGFGLRPPGRRRYWLLGGLLLCSIAHAELPATTRLDIKLEGAVLVRLARNHGRWERVVIANAREVNKTDQHGRTLSATIDDQQAKVSVTLQEEPSPWDPPRDWNRFDIEMTRAGDGYAGTWSGTFHGQARTGKATATFSPVTEIPGAPPPPDEHPRLLFRKADLPALKAKAETEWGKAEVARLRALVRGKGGPDTEGPTARAVALGLLYHLTGDAALAAEARELVVKDIPNWNNVMYVHGAAACVQQAALAYDLLCDTADQAWRDTMKSTFMVKMDYLYYPPVGGFNDNDGSNWSAMYRSAMGMAALTLLSDPTAAHPLPPVPEVSTFAPPADLRAEGQVTTPLVAGKAIGTWLHAGPFDVDRNTNVLAANARPRAGWAVEYTTRKGDKARCTFAPLPAMCRITAEQAGKYQKPVLAGGVDFAAASGRKYLTTHLLATVLEVAQTGHYRLDHSTIKLERVAVHLDGRALRNGQVVKLEAGRHLLLAETAIGACGAHEIIESYLRFEALTAAEATAWLAKAQREFAHAKAVAAIDQEDGASTEARRWLAVAEQRQANWSEIAFGDAGWNSEGEAYTQHAMRTALVFEHSFRNAIGRSVAPGGNLPATFPLYATKTVFSATNAESPSYGPGGGPLGVDNWARGFALVPEHARAACLLAWDRTQALASDGQLTGPMQPMSELDAASAAFRFVNHPGTPADAAPAATLPRTVVDRQKGGVVLRNAFAGADDSVVTILADQARIAAGWRGPDYGDIRWLALGSVWADRGIPWGNGIDLRVPDKDGVYPDLRQYGSVVSVPGCKIANSGTPGPAGGRSKLLAADLTDDGSGVVTMDLSGCYVGVELGERPRVKDLGIRATRSVAVDHTGKAGVPALMVVADRFTGTKGDETWQFCTASEHKVTTDATGFTITAKDGATLRGTVVAPTKPVITVVPAQFKHEINYHARHNAVVLQRQVIRVQGAGSLFLVAMTVQRGPAPEVKADGTTVTVGGRKARLEGTNLVLTVP